MPAAPGRLSGLLVADVSRIVAGPLGFSRTPVSYRLPPPSLGEHDDELRAWLTGPGTDR